MDGFRSVGAFELIWMGILAGWPKTASNCQRTAKISGCRKVNIPFPALPTNRRAFEGIFGFDILHGARPDDISEGQGRQAFSSCILAIIARIAFFVASAPYHAMYKAEDMPAPTRAEDPDAEAAQHPLMSIYRSHRTRFVLPVRKAREQRADEAKFARCALPIAD